MSPMDHRSTKSTNNLQLSPFHSPTSFPQQSPVGGGGGGCGTSVGPVGMSSLSPRPPSGGPSLNRRSPAIPPARSPIHLPPPPSYSPAGAKVGGGGSSSYQVNRDVQHSLLQKLNVDAGGLFELGLAPLEGRPQVC